MPRRVLLALLPLTSTFLLLGIPARSSPPQSREELDLVAKVQQAKNSKQRLALLNEWSEKYPSSPLRQQRFYYLITTQQKLGLGHDMLHTAEEMRDDDPNGLGNYWITLLTIPVNDTSEAALDRGEKAAQALLDRHNELYTPQKRPDAVPAAAWAKEKARSLLLAHRTLGWIALKRKQWPKAEKELRVVLAQDPKDADSCFWLATALLGQNTPTVDDLALYYYARALAISGAEALTPQARKQVSEFLEQAYVERHGSRQGIEQLLRQGRSGTPPKQTGSHRTT